MKVSLKDIFTGNLPQGGYLKKINTEDPLIGLYLQKLLEFDIGHRRLKKLKEEIRKLKLQIK